MGAILVLGAIVVAGCEDSTPPSPNIAPETEITSSVPRDSSSVAHHVDIHWRGADADGTPAYFQYILDTYPRSVARIDQIVFDPPAVNDARWANGRVNANHLLVVAPADTLRVDPRTAPPPLLFDRWHTFYLRAVDNEGAIDETPAFRTFKTFTAAPVLGLLEPTRVGEPAILPRAVVAHWEGYDQIGGGLGSDEQDPREARWALLRCQLDGNGDPLGFPDSLYALAPSRWSPWSAWMSAGGQSAVLRDLVPVGPNQQAWVFAVQGRDDGGAITPRFEAAPEFQNNYAVIVADGSLPVGPAIRIFVRHARVDTLQVAGDGAPPSFNVMSGTDSVSISWARPDASRYGAGATETRYGWDIDPNTESEWTLWSVVRSTPPHDIGASSVFNLQARDDIGGANASLHQVTDVQIVVQRSAAKHR
jgi:hypothetical protein